MCLESPNAYGSLGNRASGITPTVRPARRGTASKRVETSYSSHGYPCTRVQKSSRCGGLSEGVAKAAEICAPGINLRGCLPLIASVSDFSEPRLARFRQAIKKAYPTMLMASVGTHTLSIVFALPLLSQYVRAPRERSVKFRIFRADGGDTSQRNNYSHATVLRTLEGPFGGHVHVCQPRIKRLD